MDDDNQNKLDKLEATIRKQDAEHEAKQADHEARLAELQADRLDGLDDGDGDRDGDRLELLDRLAARLPELDLDQHEIEWKTLPDGGEALVVEGGGFDGGSGWFVANAGDDIHVIGSMQPMAAAIGCVVLRPDGSRQLADVRPDPLAEGRKGDEDG